MSILVAKETDSGTTSSTRHDNIQLIEIPDEASGKIVKFKIIKKPEVW